MKSMHLQFNSQIKASPDRVFAVLTRSAALWWDHKYLEGKEACDLILEPRIGGRFYERWGSSTMGDRMGVILGTVGAIQPPDLITLQGPFGMSRRAVFSVITVELKAADEGTDVSFTQHAVGDVDQALESQYKEQWQELLHRLKSLIERHVQHGIRHDPYLDHTGGQVPVVRRDKE
jgi:uncharacterized protein YndB with AHSA1/START domain